MEGSDFDHFTVFSDIIQSLPWAAIHSPQHSLRSRSAVAQMHRIRCSGTILGAIAGDRPIACRMLELAG